jgi:regulator of cell morphogenesis and NO signaling
MSAITASDIASTGFASRTLADIATKLPGATGIFRAHKLDFCCGGNVTLSEAAAKRGLSLSGVEAALLALGPGAKRAVPTAPAALIDHILTRYHDVHRRELPELIRLAARVEAVHRDHASVPAGLAAQLEEMRNELESHMLKEESILFPLMRSGGNPMIVHPIARMRIEHDEHGERLRAIEALTHGLTLPADACPTWCALYAGLRKLIDDLMEHIHLENNILFPQFGALPENVSGCGCHQ